MLVFRVSSNIAKLLYIAKATQKEIYPIITAHLVILVTYDFFWEHTEKLMKTSSVKTTWIMVSIMI